MLQPHSERLSDEPRPTPGDSRPQQPSRLICAFAAVRPAGTGDIGALRRTSTVRRRPMLAVRSADIGDFGESATDRRRTLQAIERAKDRTDASGSLVAALGRQVRSGLDCLVRSPRGIGWSMTTARIAQSDAHNAARRASLTGRLPNHRVHGVTQMPCATWLFGKMGALLAQGGRWVR